MARLRLVGYAALLGLLAVLAANSCSNDTFVGTEVGNQPPEVWLTTAPPEGSTVHYQVHMYWGGFDSDGTVEYYEWAISDNGTGAFDPADTTGADKWHAIEVGDSIFHVSADQLADSASIGSNKMQPYEFRRSHTFFIRAIDNDGTPSPVAYRSFTARTLSPTVNILFPKAVGVSLIYVPPLITFRWTARDYVDDMTQAQEPESVRTIVVNTGPYDFDPDRTLDYIRSHPDAPEWNPWVWYHAPADSGRFWRPPVPLPLGRFIFAVQAMDDAGAVSPVFDPLVNVRHLRIDTRITGPILRVNNPYLVYPIVTSAKTTPQTVLNVPAGLPLQFEFSGDASSYGGAVSGYRYGWDISELEDDSEWDIDYTPFIGKTAMVPQRTFFFGVHTLHIDVKDNSGFVSRAPITINVLPFTMDKNVLVIDDWDEGASQGFARNAGAGPSDKEHDEFWGEVLSDLDNFSYVRDTYPPEGPLRSVPLHILLQYRAIIWNVRVNPIYLDFYPNYLQKVLRASSRAQNGAVPNILRMYMTVGGKVLLCGEHPMSAVIDKVLFPPGSFGTPPGPTYPIMLRYELDGNQRGTWEDDGQEIGVHGVGDTWFGYDDACVNVLDLTWGIDFDKHRRFCPVRFVRSYLPEMEGMRAAYSVDRRHGGFPRLELRPEVAGPGKYYNESQLGLRSDIYNPAYFADICGQYAELFPRRGCFQPMLAMECKDTDSPIYGETVGFWLTKYGARTNPDGVAAWSAVWGFEPVFFNPDQVREALDIILFDEWKMDRVANSM